MISEFRGDNYADHDQQDVVTLFGGSTWQRHAAEFRAPFRKEFQIAGHRRWRTAVDLGETVPGAPKSLPGVRQQLLSLSPRRGYVQKFFPYARGVYERCILFKDDECEIDLSPYRGTFRSFQPSHARSVSHPLVCAMIRKEREREKILKTIIK